MQGTLAEAGVGTGAVVRDLYALTKPRLSALVLFTCAGGMWLAPAPLHWPRGAVALVATALVVAGANTLNEYIERDIDRRMERTADRPLPAGRLPPSWALAQGLGLAALGTILLVLAANALTAALGALAFALYVTAYTPLKRFTPLATAVGAIPGAIPPLMGWTSATGRVDAGGALLFAVLFLWQMPHFLAISIYRGADYARAGLHVGVADRGDRRTRWEIVAWSVAFLAACLALPAAGVGGRLTTAAALLFAGSFLVHGARGLRYGAGEGWARALFWHSLLALAGFFSAMVVDQLRS